MSNKPLTRATLDHMRCGIPGCASTHDEAEPMFLHGRCHMGAGNEVEYLNGVITVRCRICKKLVVQAKVAEQ